MSETMQIIVHGLVVVIAIFLGIRTGGMSIGMWGAAGVLVLAFMGVEPGEQPISAMLIILSVVSAAGAMQVAGGIDWLVKVARGIIQKHPKNITFIASYISALFTMGAGTGNIYFSLLPVIEDVSHQYKVRPERPLSVSATASQMAIVASPVSAAMAVMVGLMEPTGFDITDILIIVIPSMLVAILVMALVANRMGKEMVDDPEYQKRLASGQIQASKDVSDEKQLGPNARKSALIFLGGVFVIILFGMFEGLRPVVGAGEEAAPMSMTLLIEIIMLIIALLIILFAKANVREIPKSAVFDAGLVSMIALFGVAWLANTFIAAHEETIVTALGDVAATAPLMFAVAIFLVGALTTSQSSTTAALIPIGIALGIPSQYLIAMWMAVIGIYLFPINGSQIATVEFDRAGTTKIGNFIINHSFLIPTLIGAVVSVLVGMVIATIFFGTV
jgi:anaerobic C4-dicarboxylate transporter DcuA/anaerobic C4-dicarboxylate transporter DcuB